jgi:protein-tyrosine phosphatase
MTSVRGKIGLNVPGQVWFGSVYSSIEDMRNSFELLKNNNVNYIWNLLETSTIAEIERKKFTVIHSPVIDYSLPVDIPSFYKDAELVLNYLKDNQNIYVHCYGGHGRTGMAILYLKVLLGEDPQTALDEVREYVHGPEMNEQVVFATGRTDLNVKKISFK